MLANVKRNRRHIRKNAGDNRRGGILVVAAVLIVVVMGFAAFSVDMGYITTTKGDMKKTADASALGATTDLQSALGPFPTVSSSTAASNAGTAAKTIASQNQAGGSNTVYVDIDRDVRYGKYSYENGAWTKTWGATPYNMVEVSIHRDQAASSNGDGKLKLFFAPAIKNNYQSLLVVSRAAFKPATKVKVPSGGSGKLGILPIAIDQTTWDNLVNNGVGTDSYSYNESTGAISSGGDGVKEVSLYPSGSSAMPPGNRGTVDIGPSNNSTADIANQVLNGISQSDLDAIGMSSGIDFNAMPITLNGDTGLSAGIKDELEAIKGSPRMIPVFSSVSGPGNNAMYTIVKFVGVRIMYVQLTGSPSNKKVVVQPAVYVGNDVESTGSGTPVTTSTTIFAMPQLID